MHQPARAELKTNSISLQERPSPVSAEPRSDRHNATSPSVLHPEGARCHRRSSTHKAINRKPATHSGLPQPLRRAPHAIKHMPTLPRKHNHKHQSSNHCAHHLLYFLPPLALLRSTIGIWPGNTPCTGSCACHIAHPRIDLRQLNQHGSRQRPEDNADQDAPPRHQRKDEHAEIMARREQVHGRRP